MKIISFIVIALGLLIPLKATSEELTLDQCYQAALKRSETIADQDELIKQAEEKIKQARGYIFPSINFNASYLRQEAVSSDTSTSPSPASQPLLKLSGTQPLFRGFRDFAALKQTKTAKDYQLEAKYSAEIDLYKDVATSFFTILILENDLRNVRNEIDLYEKRVKEINERVRIGRSRVSEVLSTESSMSLLGAEVESIVGEINSVREGFAFFTGLPNNSTLSSVDLSENNSKSLEAYMKGLEDRPDIKSAKLKLETTKKNIDIAMGANYPSVDLNGNYYFYRTGSLENVNWDFTALLTMPIFAGGVLMSKTREAKSQVREAELTLSKTTRSAEEDIKSNYYVWAASISQKNALEKATKIAEQNYVLQNKEYRLGLVNNLDVLDALSSYQGALRSFDQTKYSVKLNYLKLEAAVGNIPAVN